MREPPVLAVQGLSKSFGAVRALRDVSLRAVRRARRTPSPGENGAGKSTLIKTLAGVHRPDAGRSLLDGRPGRPPRPGATPATPGVAVIYQEPTLFPDLSVAENIFMGRQPRRSLGRVDHKAVHAAAARPVRPPRRRPRPRAARARPVHRRPADRRDRQGALLRRPRADHGRADRRAHRQRGRPPLRRRPHAARAGRAPSCSSRTAWRRSSRSASGVTTLRDGAADRQRAARRPDRGRPRTPHGRPRPRRALPQAGHRRPGEVALQRAPADPRGRLHRRVVRGAARRDRRRSPGSSAPGAARSRGPSSASTGGTPGGRGRGPAADARRAQHRPWPPGSRSSPRTGAPRAW